MANNQSQYSLDENSANDILQNILKNCDIKPNDIPLNKLRVRHTKKYTSFYIIKGLCIFFFLITLFCPLFLPQPDDKLTVEERAIKNLNIIEYRHEGEYLYFELNKEILLSTSRCYLLTDHGEQYPIAFYDTDKNEVSFIYPSENATIILTSNDGKTLRMYLQNQK